MADGDRSETKLEKRRLAAAWRRTPRSANGIPGAAATMGRGTHFCLDWPLPPIQ